MVRSSAVLLGAALLLAACDAGGGGGTGGGGGGDAGTSEAAASMPVDEAQSPFVRKFPASTGGGPAEPIRTVVRDAVAWTELWAKANAHVSPVPKAPTVDFAKEMVAFAGLGRKPTTGFSVEIVGTVKEPGKLTLLYIEREPLKGFPVATVETDPWHAVVLARTDLPVEWEKYEPKPRK